MHQVACPANSHGVSTVLGCICNKAVLADVAQGLLDSADWGAYPVSESPD